MWEERAQMGPPPAPPGTAATERVGTVPLAGWAFDGSGLDPKRRTVTPRTIGVMIVAACVLVMAKDWFFALTLH